MTDLDLHTGLPRTPAVYEPSPFVLDPTGGRLIAWASAARAAHALAESLVKTSFVPKDFRGKAEEATAVILLGDELGLSPISALRSVYMVHGTPSIYARTMVALVQSHGHEVWTESSTPREVIVAGRRRGSEHVETAVWDIDRARTAGYTSNAKYQTNPQEMLWAKAASEVCKKIASDVLAGVPLSVEDLELEHQPTAPVQRAPRRVQRQAAPKPPEPAFEDTPAVPSQDESPPVRPIQVAGPKDPIAYVQGPPPEPDPINDAQSKKLHAALRDNDLAARDDALAYISGVIGRDIATTKELSKDEASRVIDSLSSPPEPDSAEPPLDGDWPPVKGAEQ